MKFKKILSLWICILFLFYTVSAFAHDTDLYTAGGEGVQPNVLFIIDNSCSMKSSVSTGTAPYDKTFTYPADPSYPSVNKDYVYEYTGSWDKTLQDLKVFKTSISGVDCSTARNDLTSKGVTYNRYTNSTCNKTQKTLATGNFLNFYLYNDKWLPNMPKIDIAKKVITDILETMNGVNVGLMIFTPGGDGGKVITYIDDIDIDSHRSKIISDVNAIVNECGTPLGKTLYEAGLYFAGKPSYFNAPLDYSSVKPTQYSCQKNFAIFMTDGMSSSDDNLPSPLPTAIGDQDGDKKEPPVGTDHNHFLDDVAKYLYDNDLDPNLEGTQNVVTYTIGFDIGSDAEAKDLLNRAADNNHGHGKFYLSGNALALAGAFATAVDEVLGRTTSFVAPIVPVSKMERTTAGDKIYLAFFKPKQNSMWAGNIKKYGVQQTNDTSKGLVVGDILDVSGSKALDSDGEFHTSSKSYWTTSSSDGGEAEKGGVGEILKSRTSARKIYTLLPGDAQDEDTGSDSNTSFDLTNDWNAFSKTNSRLTSSILAVSSDQKDPLIDFIHGIDIYDDNLNGQTTDKRDWLLGSFLHSRPYIIHYKGRSVIYAGANDGMLHAFDDASGEELWGFIPPCFLSRLKDLHTTNPGIFVDGSPKAYVTYDGSGNVTKAILIFGLRRGGNYYYALDVQDPEKPKFLWRIYKDRENKGGGSIHYYQDLGQTWSTPVIGKVAYGTGERVVAIFGAGYDIEMDAVSPDQPNVNEIYAGRGVYMADVESGNCLWWRSKPGGESAMTYPIPSDIAPLDLNGDGRIDRLYVGDLNGQMWRFDIGDLNKDGNSQTTEWTAKLIFYSNPGGSEKRRIFYPPDVTFEKDSTGEYEMVFFGTGDREDPKGVKIDKDVLVAFKDKNVSKKTSDLIDVTNFYSLSAGQQASTIDTIKTGYGWYIKLDKKDGEKCLATPVVYAKTAYFTTFSPSSDATGDPCFVGEGTATLYAMNYATGEAAFNFDDPTNLGVGAAPSTKSDRSLIIGTAIPSGVVITVIGGKVTAYVGVGGGVYRPELSSTKSLFPLTWKLVF